LQLEIENFTFVFDEKSILKTSRDLIDLMIHDDLPSARDIILRMKGIDDFLLFLINLMLLL
jgi:hypothetical protein